MSSRPFPFSVAVGGSLFIENGVNEKFKIIMIINLLLNKDTGIQQKDQLGI